MVSHLQIRVAHSAERCCARKIKIKPGRNQATRKMGYLASRGRQTTSQEGLHPQAVLPIEVQVCNGRVTTGDSKGSTLEYY